MRYLARELQEQEVAKDYRFEISIDIDEVDLWNERFICDIVVVGNDEDESEIIEMIDEVLNNLYNVQYFSWTYRTNGTDSDKYDYLFSIEVEM